MPNPDIISSLTSLRTSFGRANASRKRRLLDRASRVPLADPALIREYHDLLLFMAAHPDDAAMLHRIQRELNQIARTVQGLPNQKCARLEDTGIAGTTIVCQFSLNICTWLARQFKRNAVLDWDDDDEALLEYLNQLIATVERDGLLCDRLSTQEWVQLAAGRRQTDLAWLVRRFNALPAAEEIREKAFTALDLSIRWSLRDRHSSRTFVRFPARRIHWQRGDLIRSPNVQKTLDQPIPSVRPLARSRAQAVLNACLATLSARRREIDTLACANEKEVYLVRLENGFDVAIFGMTPARRLPIESYFGFVMARNRVPIGYGGGWVLLDRCEIGVNIFDEFRGGESVSAFAQVLRVYRHHFRAKYFTVDPFQFGAGNTEAIRSGAFWFYYRLGFRPIDPRTANLAEQERQRLSADRAARSPAAALRRLASARLRLDVSPKSLTCPEIIDIGLAVTKWIAKRFKGDRPAAEKWAVQRAIQLLDVKGMSRWPAAERAAFERLSLLVAMRADHSLPESHRKSLIRVMRAKGGPTERSFALNLHSSVAFRAILEDAAKSGARIAADPKP